MKPGVNPTYIDSRIVHSPQLEATREFFEIRLFHNALSQRQFKFECEYIVVVIEDDDTANISFPESKRRTVAEDADIVFTINVDGENGNCIVPHPITFTFTPSGQTTALESGSDVKTHRNAALYRRLKRSRSQPRRPPETKAPDGYISTSQ